MVANCAVNHRFLSNYVPTNLLILSHRGRDALFSFKKRSGRFSVSQNAAVADLNDKQQKIFSTASHSRKSTGVNNNTNNMRAKY